jgi:glutaredoxin-like YruB-family protein
MEQKTVTIYTTPTCHFCQMSKELFAANNIAYTEYNVATDVERRTEMVERSGQRGVPVIYIGDEMIIGFDKKRIDEALGLASAPVVTAAE